MTEQTVLPLELANAVVNNGLAPKRHFRNSVPSFREPVTLHLSFPPGFEPSASRRDAVARGQGRKCGHDQSCACHAFIFSPLECFAHRAYSFNTGGRQIPANHIKTDDYSKYVIATDGVD